MEEPFGGVMTMGERSDHPQVLGSTGSEPRADPGAGVPFRRVGRHCKQAAGCRLGAVRHGRSGR